MNNIKPNVEMSSLLEWLYVPWSRSPGNSLELPLLVNEQRLMSQELKTFIPEESVSKLPSGHLSQRVPFPGRIQAAICVTCLALSAQNKSLISHMSSCARRPHISVVGSVFWGSGNSGRRTGISLCSWIISKASQVDKVLPGPCSPLLPLSASSNFVFRSASVVVPRTC